MESQYTTQFPDLMSGKTLMYVHGFASSAQSGTVSMLRAMLPEASVVACDLPIHPAEALARLHEMCDECRPDIIVGTSMGGMYAELLHGYDRILVNPAFRMGDTMSKFMGRQVFSNPRADGVQEFMVTKSLIKEYAEVTARCLSDVSDDDRRRVVGMFGDEDDTVDTYRLFLDHYPTAIKFHGGHRLTDSIASHYLLPVIRYIDDRQEGRERPVIYLDIAALRDGRGNAVPSMHKAYERLISRYSVYIVAPSPACDPCSMQSDMAWVERYLSAPAWGRVVFANDRRLLYGDYMVEPRGHVTEGFMGTVIEWGSDEFKTWEEIITFFDRLGGQ